MEFIAVGRNFAAEDLGFFDGSPVEPDRNVLLSVTFSGYNDFPRIGLL